MLFIRLDNIYEIYYTLETLTRKIYVLQIIVYIKVGQDCLSYISSVI